MPCVPLIHILGTLYLGKNTFPNPGNRKQNSIALYVGQGPGVTRQSVGSVGGTQRLWLATLGWMALQLPTLSTQWVTGDVLERAEGQDESQSKLEMYSGP